MTDLRAVFGPRGFDVSEYERQRAEIPAAGRDSLAAYAQLYAQRGWKVLPLHSINGKLCTCGDPACKSPGKHPRTHRGSNDATDDRGIIAGWWRTWPDANIGIATGRASGFWVLDVDPRNGGVQSLDALSDKVGGLPDTVTAITGGGGQHYLFALPEFPVRGGGDKFGPGLDVKGEGGYIVVEPSAHLSGTHYVWEASSDPLEGIDVRPAPALEALLTAVREKTPPAAGDYVLPPQKVAEIRSALAFIPADDRDSAWLPVGMALHSTGAGQQSFGMWNDWSQLSPKYDAADQRRVWDSFNRDAGGITLSTLFALAKQNGWTEAGGSWLGSQPMQAPGEAAQHSGFEFIPYDELTADPQPPEWLITDFIERDTLCVMYGDSDTYKSFIALDIGLNVAASMPWHGRATLGGAVFYICGEGHRGVARRVSAWQKQHGVTARLPFFASRTGAELTAEANARAVSDACASLAQSCQQEPVLIIVDTLAANFGAADENSTKDMGQFLKMVTRLLRERFGAAVLVVHHVGHQDKERERGAYNLRGNADARIRVARTDMLSAAMHCEKMKDAERWAPLQISLEVVPLGIVDAQGRPVTSLAVASATENENARTTNEGRRERVTPIPPPRRGRGFNQVVMLRELRRLTLEHEKNVGPGGRARVLSSDWRQSVEDGWGIDRKRAWEVISGMKTAGLITIEGKHVELTAAGIEAIEADR